MKMYTKPEIEISVFATEDIITASDTPVTPTGLTPSGDLSDSAQGAVPYTDIIS